MGATGLQHLCEKSCPYRLDTFDVGGLDESLKLVGLRTISGLSLHLNKGAMLTVISTPSSAKMRAA